MPKQIVIEVPDWVNSKIVEDLKKMLTEVLEEKMKSDKVDIDLYRIYFALKYPESKNVKFELDEELKMLREMREKERKRIE